MVIVSYGAGDNSTAMLAMMSESPDLVLFADTGGEKPGTYWYVVGFSAWLEGRGFPPITVVREKRRGEPMSLEEHCLRTKRLPSLAYGFKSCSMKFKRDPQDRYLNQWAPAQDVWKSGGKVVKLIGYHYGEKRRAAIEEDAKYVYRYPLIEAQMDAEDCILLLRERGLPPPGKSACFFCPATKPREILDLPCDLKKRALSIERNAETRASYKGLGGRFKWSDVIEADANQTRMSFWPPSPPCDCTDGWDDD